MPSTGALLCLASAVAFGAMAIFGKLAYDEGATVGTLLSVRFLIAAALFWVLVAATGAPARCARSHAATSASRSRSARWATARRRAPTSPPWSGSTRRCSRCSLYTFPAIVTVAAIVLGRERASRRTAGALVLASGGLVLVLAGARRGRARPAGNAAGARRPRSSTAPTSSARRASPSASARSC